MHIAIPRAITKEIRHRDIAKNIQLIPKRQERRNTGTKIERANINQMVK